ncbi:MAG TPA: hypothetical protein VGE69_15930 [Pseudomonadales bacterium]
MRVQRFVQAAIVGLLYTAGSLLAQGTMENRQGSRHAGPGAVNPSTATFAVGVTRDSGASFVTTAGINDTVQIRGEIRPEADNIGQTADIFVVDRLLGGGFKMRDQSGVWIDWNASVSSLVPFREDVFLDAVESVDMFSGTLGLAGEHRLFLGYLPPDGILRYHTSGSPLAIAEVSTQTPQEQAKALFAMTIHQGIVQDNCTFCHRPGDGATAGVHQFAIGSGQAEIDANFEKFNAMMARGKDYILGKVRGENGHLGGAALPRNSAAYPDFERFLTLLEQR